MKKNSIFTIIGIIVAAAAVVAAAIYFIKKLHICGCDEYEEDLLEYIDGDDCGCGCEKEDEAAAEPPAEQ